jgi:thiol-disulfide isomerase/thioredoxin
MPSNNNLKSMKLNMPKTNQTWAVLGVVILLIALIIVLYYMRKSNSNESFEQVNNNNTQKQMTDTQNTTTNDKPNLTPANGETVVALFYTDWCPHCQDFKPDYMKAMNTLNGKVDKDDKKLRLEMVDCDVHKELGRKYNVNGYPTIKLIKDDGSHVEYGGERNFEGLRKYLLGDN